MQGVYDMAAGDTFQGHRIGSLIGRAFYDPEANYGGVIEAISWPGSSPSPLSHLSDGHTFRLESVVDHLYR